jgi:5-formyltetrahydrofolate cyclo-ligase
MAEAADLDTRKAAIRAHARKTRAARPDKDAASRQIVAAFLARPEYAAAGTVLFYLDAGSEVRTRPHLPAVLASGKRVVVPYCVTETNELGLFRLEDVAELVEGAYRILEPRPDLRAAPGKSVDPAELDLVMVPGVAFDPRGGRLGQGKGYYDRLLAKVRPNAPLIGLAFDCQMVPEVPAGPHDVVMDWVLTETAAYRG